MGSQLGVGKGENRRQCDKVKAEEIREMVFRLP